MRRLKQQALLFFALPVGLSMCAVFALALSGELKRVLTEGPTPLDWTVGVALTALMLIPPIWGYRLVWQIAKALSDMTEVMRRVASGDFTRTLAAWAGEHSELEGLEQGIQATALQLQQRLVDSAQEKSRLEAVLRNMMDGLILIDARKKVRLINHAAEMIFSISRQEVIGHDHLEITHHFDLDERIEEVLRTGRPAVVEIRRARPDEQVLECHIAPAGDGLSGVLLVLRDITRFRKLEKMRSEFVANVTHELRTPLTSIRGFTETLLDGALDDAEAARRFIEIIHRESGHLSRLIEDILYLSRIESGKWKMLKEPIDLEALVKETTARLQPRAEELGVDLQVHIPQPLPTVQGDPTRLAQVLINLIDNALKYTPGGGRVTVSASDAGGYTTLEVSDTGSGIPKADLPRIFERFYRVDKARTRQKGGTGLGLSIVKHIVDAHGGTIGVVSDTGQGATFTVRLPR